MAIWGLLFSTAASGAAQQAHPNLGPLTAAGELFEDIEAVFEEVSPRSPVLTLAWSPDGEMLVAGTAAGTVQLWDARTGVLRRRLDGLSTAVASIAYSPDGRWLAVASEHGIVQVWDLETHTVSVKLSGWSVAFHPDSQRLATGFADGTLRVLNVQTTETLRTEQRLHRNRISSIAWSPDGSTLMTGSWDWTVRLLEMESGRLLHRLEGHQQRVSSVAWSPEGRAAASGSFDGLVRVWNVQTGEETHRYDRHSDAILSLAWSPLGPAIASASRDATVRVWDLLASREIAVFELHKGPVFCVAFSPDGRRLASGSADGTVRVWTMVHTRREVHRLEGHASRVLALAFNGRGDLLAAGSEGGDLRVWPLGGLTGSADPQQPWVSSRADQSHSSFKRLSALSLTPEGDVLAAGFSDGTVEIWRVSSTPDSPLERRSAHDLAVTALAFSLNGRILASGSEDQTVRFWSRDDNRESGKLPHSGIVQALAFGPSGRTFAAATSDRIVSLWTWAEGAEIGDAELRQELVLNDVVQEIAFASEKRLYLVLSNREVLLWERSAGLPRQIHRLPARISAVAASPSGLLASARSNDGLVRVETTSNMGYRVTDLLLGGSRGTWISCQAAGRCWRNDDGTLLVREDEQGTLDPIPPTADSPLLEVVSAPRSLLIADGEMATFTVEIQNTGPGTAFWTRLTEVPGAGGRQVIYYPPKTRVTLEKGETESFECQASFLADYANPESGNLVLALEATSSSGESIAVPPISISSSSPTLALTGPRLSFDGSKIHMTLSNTTDEAMRASHFEVTPSGHDRLIANLILREISHPLEAGSPIELNLFLPENQREDFHDKIDVTVYTNRAPIHQWRFSERAVHHPVISSKSLYLLVAVFLVALVLFVGSRFMRKRATQKKSPFMEWAGAEHVKLAVVFTDIIDSTSFAAGKGDKRWTEAHKAHLDHIRPLIKKNNGFLVKSTGDGFMVAFRSARHALEFAVGIECDTGHEEIRIRAGIHEGEVEVGDNDAHGKVVHMAARITGIAEDGGVVVSTRVKETVDDFWGNRNPYSWTECPDIDLKGFKETVTLWSVHIES